MEHREKAGGFLASICMARYLRRLFLEDPYPKVTKREILSNHLHENSSSLPKAVDFRNRWV